MKLNSTPRWAFITAYVAMTCASTVGAGEPSPVETPAAAAYYYDAGGIHFVNVAESEFLVKPRISARRAAGSRPSQWPAKVAPANAEEFVVRMEERLERRDLHVVRGLSAAQIEQLSDVEYALPVVYRAESDVPLYQTNRIIARLRDGADERSLRAFADANGCDIQKAARGEGRYYITLRTARAVQPLTVAAALHEKQELVVYAEPDFFAPMVTYSPPVINDPLYLSMQWHLDGDVSKGALANSDINAEAAWDSDHGADAEGVSSVRVSVLDECVEKLHPDLFPNWAAGLDLDPVPPDDDPSPDAGQRHGTACAGVAVAKGNSIGVRGACPNCGLIGVKFFGATVSETADGFYFSVDPDDNGDHSDGAAIMSNSWGYGDGVFQPADVVASINYAATNGRNGLGCLVLFASANSDHTVNGVTAMAQLPTVMAVGGTNSNGVHTEFSDIGPEVGIATPTNDRGDDGVRFSWIDITTVDNTGTSGYNGIAGEPDYTNAFGGTSSATPLAAGVLGLIISQDPTMTAAQARAILQHTAVRIDEPYGRFDGVTGHSHRLGFGRADAGLAVAAANAGTRWPDRIKTMSATPIGSDITLTWSTPLNDYADSILVKSDKPFNWMPTDGATYNVSDVVTPVVTVVYIGAAGVYVDAGAASGAFFYAAYPRSALNRYGFGAKTHLIRDGIDLLFDNSEGADPGWTHGGTNDEWQRGTPTAVNAAFSQAVAGSGPMAGTRGVRAIGGNKCWGTDLTYTYDAGTDAYLQTPLLNLTGVTAPVILDYHDWCLLETYYDSCRVEVVDSGGNLLGLVDGDTGGDYDWTRRAYDLTPFAGRPIYVRFRLTSDGIYQRDGWFIDDVRITVAAQGPLPPVAKDRSFDTAENVTAVVTLLATDPNPATTLSMVITSLPSHGQLVDPNSGPIASVPHTVASNGNILQYNPATNYQGPDSFTYKANDGALDSNTATVKLTIGTPVPIYNYPLDVDPGWIAEGQWAFGQPGGADGDPTTGFTGLSVYGYNLAGAYPDLLPAQYLTMPPLNCTGLTRVTLKFARWLGVENAAFDKATIQVSTDGDNWTTVFTNGTSDLEEAAWSQQSYIIGAVADDEPFVLVRWGMGPTDSNTNFSGWNIDDVAIWAIGSIPTNQPPFAQNIVATTATGNAVNLALPASDPELDPLAYRIVSLPADGSLSDPNGGAIVSVPYTLLAGGNVVTYTPDISFGGVDTFLFRADDGQIESNAATASITVLNPAAFPFTEDFEGGSPLVNHWTLKSTSTGRIRIATSDGPIGTYHALLDSAASSSFGNNELTLVVNLTGQSNVLLQYSWKEFGDESNTLPATFTTSANGDGVAISADGVAWHRIAHLTEGTGTYQTVLLDLDAAAAGAGIAYNTTFRIRFQQYDNNPVPTDGIALDNIMVLQGTGDPEITTATLPDGELKVSYGPEQLEAVGGDLPLTWTLLDDEYGEESLGASQFAAVGTGQGWQADDAAFDYVLPFAFPFYGQPYTNVKIATDGWINFGPYDGATYTNSTTLLAANKRIAVMWDDLKTNVVGGDIFIDTTVTGQVTIRWQGTVRAGGAPANCSAILFDDGRIQMHYGAGNTGMTPTVGVSLGDNATYTLFNYDGDAALTNADSVEVQLSELPPGISLSSSGLVSGTPTATGLFKPIFHIVDQSARTDTRKIPLNIPVLMFGDFDGDFDVDAPDFDQFRLCFTGPEGVIGPECERGDSDGDGDVDCEDWREFRDAFFASSGYTPALPIDDFVAVLLEDMDATDADRCLADTNDDDINDGEDIQPHTDALLSQP
ncbi:MAG TPA: S8 family serine peptidase [Phycisphaerae bacterium]|nr:S8 family serine peptidase [Phycisphaerae bacterium]